MTRYRSDTAPPKAPPPRVRYAVETCADRHAAALMRVLKPVGTRPVEHPRRRFAQAEGKSVYSHKLHAGLRQCLQSQFEIAIRIAFQMVKTTIAECPRQRIPPPRHAIPSWKNSRSRSTCRRRRRKPQRQAATERPCAIYGIPFSSRWARIVPHLTAEGKVENIVIVVYEISGTSRPRCT